MLREATLQKRRTAVKRRALTSCLAALTLLGLAPAALGSQGGPNPNSCGVGSAEAHAFKADPTFPGASEIRLYPPVAFGCTGPKK
jgi:hypothetical protein